MELVKSHLARFVSDPANEAMVQRLEAALEKGERITGADASFYLHEASESTLMKKGTEWEEAHVQALEKYRVSNHTVYAREVVQEFSSWFNST